MGFDELSVRTRHAHRLDGVLDIRGVATLATFLPIAICLTLFGFAILNLLMTSFYAPSQDGAQQSTLTLVTYQRILADPLYRATIVGTLRMSAITTIVSVALGLPVSFWMSNTRSRRTRSVLIVLVAVPFLTSLVVRLYALMLLLGNAGLVNHVLRAAGILPADGFIPLIRNPLSVVIGLTYFVLPFVIFTLCGSFRRHDRTLAEAARTVGADELMTLLHIQLPLIMPGVGAAATLAFVLASTAFATPLILGGSTVRMLGNAIYDEAVVSQNLAAAAGLSLIALMLTVCCLTIVSRLGRTRRAHG